MSLNVDKPISRRSFLKWTGAATAASVTAAQAPVLHALVPEKKRRDARESRESVFSVRHVLE